jgi:hypothetical protein
MKRLKVTHVSVKAYGLDYARIVRLTLLAAAIAAIIAIKFGG